MTRLQHRIVLATASCLLLAACGSTVNQSRAGLGPSSLGDGPGTGLQNPAASGAAQSGSTGSGAPLVQTGSTTGGGSTGGAAVPGSTSGGSTGGTTGVGGGSGSVGGGAALGPGVTATEIRLGIPYCNDCASANAAAGASGEDPGDTREYYKAALADVNDRGGVLGRKLVPAFHQVSVSDNIDVSQQATCQAFTQDTKVFAIFFRGEITYKCAQKAGIIAVGGGGSGPLYARYRNLFAPASIRLERLGAVTVKAMVHAGWQKPEGAWPTGKIGLITWETNEYRYAMEKGWLPALHDAGLKETDVRYVAVPQSNTSLADASAAISSDVLAFRNEGIDHVFISDGPAGIFAGTGLTFLFLSNAKSQRYYPRYGFNTNNTPAWANHPADEEVGMLAVDSFDIKAANDDGIALNPQRERCFNVMRKHGLKVGQDQTQFLALNACEIAWFTEAIVKRSRTTLLADVIAGGEALGTSYRSPLLYGTKLGPGQHDGTQLFRNASFDPACNCMRYSSKPYEP